MEQLVLSIHKVTPNTLLTRNNGGVDSHVVAGAVTRSLG